MTGVLIERGRDTRSEHTEREEHVKTYREMTIYKPQRQIREENSPADILVLDFQPLERRGNKFLLFKLSHLRYVVMAAGAN